MKNGFNESSTAKSHNKSLNFTSDDNQNDGVSVYFCMVVSAVRPTYFYATRRTTSLNKQLPYPNEICGREPNEQQVDTRTTLSFPLPILLKNTLFEVDPKQKVLTKRYRR